MINKKEDLIGTIFNIANDEGDANVRLAGMFYDVCAKYGIRVMGGNGRDYFMKAVGEGLVNLCIADDDGLGAFGRVSVSKDSVFGACSHSMSNFRNIDESELKAHLEGSISQPKEVEWVDGLPPVGVECEVRFRTDGEWTDWFSNGKLKAGYDSKIWFSHDFGECVYPAHDIEFRKPESPEDKAKREREEERVNEVSAMCLRVTSLRPSQARSLYDAGYRCTTSS